MYTPIKLITLFIILPKLNSLIFDPPEDLCSTFTLYLTKTYTEKITKTIEGTCPNNLPTYGFKSNGRKRYPYYRKLNDYVSSRNKINKDKEMDIDVDKEDKEFLNEIDHLVRD